MTLTITVGTDLHDTVTLAAKANPALNFINVGTATGLLQLMRCEN